MYIVLDINHICLFFYINVSTQETNTLINILPALDEEERILEMRRLLHDELIEDNYYIIKYVTSFLTEVKKILVHKGKPHRYSFLFYFIYR